MVGMTWDGKPFDWTQLDALVGIAATLATLVAVWVSVLVARREHNARMAAEKRANDLEDHARVQAEEVRSRAERAQASRIVVGVERYIGFTVTNRSNDSIRSARAQAFHSSVGALVSHPVDVVDPGVTKVIDGGSYQHDLPENVWFQVPYAVVFIDDGDRWWARFSDGSLLRLPDDVDAGRTMVAERLERA